jgi:FixJ family two-component response regulator
MQSAYTEYNEEAKLLGASDFIEKPYNSDNIKIILYHYLV